MEGLGVKGTKTPSSLCRTFADLPTHSAGRPFIVTTQTRRCAALPELPCGREGMRITSPTLTFEANVPV